jgi:hypothetical protein
MIIAEIAHYDFFEDSACVAASDTVLTANRGAIPSTFTYASAQLKSTSGAHTYGRIGGRITSNGAYPSLGVASGVNYVWRDSAGGAQRILTVPVDVSAPLMWLTVGSGPYAPGTVTGLRCAMKISVGFCLGCGGSGHCNAETTQRAFAPADTSTIHIHP